MLRPGLGGGGGVGTVWPGRSSLSEMKLRRQLGCESLSSLRV